MERFSASEFVGGWFVGAFHPTLLFTPDFEVCVKRYSAGERETVHHQLTAVEITFIISGECRLGNEYLQADDIVKITAPEAADFEALTDVVLVAIKAPSAPNDKRLGVFHGSE